MAAWSGRVVVVSNRLDGMERRLLGAVQGIVAATCGAVVAGAMRRSRVDTGAMKGAWQSETEDTRTGAEGVVFNVEEHSIYNEFGTRGMSAKPMVRPSVREEYPKMVTAMKNLERAL